MIDLPLVAASPIAAVLTDLFVVLLAAKLGDELFKRIRQPAIVGEILAGVVVGPSVLGIPYGRGRRHVDVPRRCAGGATSVGITSAVLIELGVLEHRASRTILGAAIVDDILAMILLAVAGGIAGSRLDPWSIAVTVLLALGFVAFFALGGTRLTARRPAILHAPRFSESPFAARRHRVPGPLGARQRDRPGGDHRCVPCGDDRRRDA